MNPIMPKATFPSSQSSNPPAPFPTRVQTMKAQATKRKPPKPQTVKAQALKAKALEDQVAKEQAAGTQAAENRAAEVGNPGSEATKGPKVLLTLEEKKRNHVISEQNRREKMRSGFDRIAMSLPGFEDKARSESVILNQFVKTANDEARYRSWLVAEVQSLGGKVEDRLVLPETGSE